VGGDPWREGCTFDRALLAAAREPVVTLIPTAAAYERPEHHIALATEWFGELGGTVRVLDVYRRPDAMNEAIAADARDAAFLYLAGGSPMHLISVLKRSLLWAAILDAWQRGAVLAGAGSGADVLCDPMVDTRGGAFTVGLGLLSSFSIIPRANTLAPETIHRTVQLGAAGQVIAAIPEQTALLRDPDGTWRVEGVGEVRVYVDGHEASLDVLPSTPAQAEVG
jgi:cyanophycinase